MSILLTRTNEPHTTATAEATLETFNTLIDTFTETEDQDTQVVLSKILLKQYGIYSYIYLQSISYTLKANNDMKDTLAFMNSVLAEVLHKTHIAYFHRELGYSIVDKAIAYVQEFGDDEGFDEHISEVIVEMNKELAEEAEAEAIIREEEAKLLAKAGK